MKIRVDWDETTRGNAGASVSNRASRTVSCVGLGGITWPQRHSSLH